MPPARCGIPSSSDWAKIGRGVEDASSLTCLPAAKVQGRLRSTVADRARKVFAFSGRKEIARMRAFGNKTAFKEGATII